MNNCFNSRSQLKYRPDIDGLRALAVLSAVFFHAFPEWMAGGGFIGPEVFFVISGFLISTIIFEGLERGTFTFREFYARRIRRVFPALLLVLIACYVVGWYELLGGEYKQLGKHIAAGAGFVSNVVLWGEAGYFDNSAETKILLHLWTLAIEEQFYLIWPPLLWVCWKGKINLLLITVLIAAISFYLNVVGVHKDAVATFYFPQTRFWELLCGAVLAWFTVRKFEVLDCVSALLQSWIGVDASRRFWERNSRWLSNVASFTGAILLSYGFYKIKATFSFPGYWAVIPVVATVLIIMAGSNAWLNRVILSNRILVGIGLISYPLYLWHWPLLSFIRIVEGVTPARNIRLAIVAFSVVLAWVTYKFVERPIRSGKYNRVKTLLLVVLMAVVGCIGYGTYKRDGLEFRFPAEIKSLTQSIDFKWGDYVRWNKCHLEDPNLLKHDEICYEKTRPLVGLWGDSHASALYPGLKKLQTQRKFGVMQLTEAGCGPIFNLEKLLHSPNCNAINHRVLQDYIAAKPDVLILHGAWVNFQYPLSDEELYVKFSATVKEIKAKLPGTHIVIIGPVPWWGLWGGSPQRTSFSYWRKSFDKREVPILQPAILLNTTDEILSRIAKENGVEYISAISELCENSTCISRVGENPEDFIAIDYGHFSKSGSEYFIKKLEIEILK